MTQNRSGSPRLNRGLRALQHRPKALNKLLIHKHIGDHLIKLVSFALKLKDIALLQHAGRLPGMPCYELQRCDVAGGDR